MNSESLPLMLWWLTDPLGVITLLLSDLGVSASGPRHEPEGDFRERLEERWSSCDLAGGAAMDFFQPPKEGRGELKHNKTTFFNREKWGGTIHLDLLNTQTLKY